MSAPSGDFMNLITGLENASAPLLSVNRAIIFYLIYRSENKCNEIKSEFVDISLIRVVFTGGASRDIFSA